MKLYKYLAFAMSCTVLIAILGHSVHTAGHLIEDFGKHCDHQYNTGKTEITHAHHAFEKCFECEFTLSGFVKPDPLTFNTCTQVDFPEYNRAGSGEIVSFFCGSLFLHRGPPLVTL